MRSRRPSKSWMTSTMANSRDFLNLIGPMLSEMAKLYPPVRLMVNYDNLHDAYIVRASVGPVESQQYVYMHEIEKASLLPTVVNLFYERAMYAIRGVIPEHHAMQGASEYDEIIHGQEIMDQLKPQSPDT